MIKIGATICINISSPDGTQLMLPCDGITSSGRVAQPPTGKHGGCPILRAICARRVGGRLLVTRHCFHDARAENEIFPRLTKTRGRRDVHRLPSRRTAEVLCRFALLPKFRVQCMACQLDKIQPQKPHKTRQTKQTKTSNSFTPGYFAVSASFKIANHNSALTPTFSWVK
jgi:hypothetical protein